MRILQYVQAHSRAFYFQECSIVFSFFKKAHVNLPSSDGVLYFTQVRKLLHGGSFNNVLAFYKTEAHCEYNSTTGVRTVTPVKCLYRGLMCSLETDKRNCPIGIIVQT